MTNKLMANIEHPKFFSPMNRQWRKQKITMSIYKAMHFTFSNIYLFVNIFIYDFDLNLTNSNVILWKNFHFLSFYHSIFSASLFIYLFNMMEFYALFLDYSMFVKFDRFHVDNDKQFERCARKIFNYFDFYLSKTSFTSSAMDFYAVSSLISLSLNLKFEQVGMK